MQALASLAIVGAGPKGLAIAAKRVALARTGREVPDLVLIDRAGVATNWSGTSGYTDGRQPLSTPPEKDVGFPYAPSWGPASGQVSDEVRRWSWQRYLIGQGGLADWVDRGQPRPDHRAWHRYLRWVAEQLGVEPVLAEVVGIDLADGRWRLSTRRTSTGEPLALDCDGLVLTGPGAPLRLPGQPDHHPRILDGRSFRTAGAALSSGGPVEVCVVGRGETAGSITSALVGLLPEGSVIELVSDHGVLYTRGESLTENACTPTPTPPAGGSWPSGTAASSSSAPTGACSRSRSRSCSTGPGWSAPWPGGSPTWSRSRPRSSWRSTTTGAGNGWPSTGWWRSASTRCGSCPCSAAAATTPWPRPSARPPAGRRPARPWNGSSATTWPSRACGPGCICRSWPGSPRARDSPTSPASASSPTGSCPQPGHRPRRAVGGQVVHDHYGGRLRGHRHHRSALRAGLDPGRVRVTQEPYVVFTANAFARARQLVLPC